MSAIAIGLGLMAAGGLLKGGTQLGFGIADRRKGKQMEAAAGDRPEYEIPESVSKALSLYEQMASGGLPGYSQSKADIEASTARTIGSASQLADSPVGALTALGGAKDRELAEYRDLNRRAEQFAFQSNQALAGAYGQQAAYQDEAWRQNQLLPWEIAMNRSMQLQTSGGNNIQGAMDSFGSTMATMGSGIASYGMQGGNFGGPAPQASTQPPPPPPTNYFPSSGMGGVQNEQQYLDSLRNYFINT